MKWKIHLFIVMQLLIITNNLCAGKINNKTKNITSKQKLPNKKEGLHNERTKRSLDDEDRPFWANRGKKLADFDYEYPRFDNEVDPKERRNNLLFKTEKDTPFWGSRGRRDSSSNENVLDADLINGKICRVCYPFYKLIKHAFGTSEKDRRDDMPPFWGNRGRRSSDEEEFQIRDVRDEDDSPFWGNRGRREELPFWGTRGRREEEDPFWGSRGRRDASLPFWGNRGRREDEPPFWGNRGRRDDDSPFWGNRGKRKSDTDSSLEDAVLDIEKVINPEAKSKRNAVPYFSASFWNNRGRNSKLRYLFSNRPRIKSQFVDPITTNANFGTKVTQSKTIHDDRFYADEPRFIIVDRSSRSASSEDYNPQEYGGFKSMEKPVRDRRGIIEEIVKSVRNDPYYIARGKKDNEITKEKAFFQEHKHALKQLCSFVDLLKTEGKSKRSINDSERDRRTILKKLAAQLQMDPYFVSRGKKSENNTLLALNVDEIIKQTKIMCTHNDEKITNDVDD